MLSDISHCDNRSSTRNGENDVRTIAQNYSGWPLLSRHSRYFPLRDLFSPMIKCQNCGQSHWSKTCHIQVRPFGWQKQVKTVEPQVNIINERWKKRLNIVSGMSYRASNIWWSVGIAKGAFEKRNNISSNKKISLEAKKNKKKINNGVRVLRKCDTHNYIFDIIGAEVNIYKCNISNELVQWIAERGGRVRREK